MINNQDINDNDKQLTMPKPLSERMISLILVIAIISGIITGAMAGIMFTDGVYSGGGVTNFKVTNGYDAY